MHKNNDTFFKNDEHHSSNDAFNRLKKEISETDEEYVWRIKQIAPLEVGIAFLNSPQKNSSNENLLFSYSLEQSLPFVLEKPNVFYVSLKDVVNLFQTGNLLKYPLLVSLTVFKGSVMADTKTFSLKIGNYFIPCSPVYLKKLFFESDEEFSNRITKIPMINIGDMKLQKELYNSDLELFPGFLETHKWLEGTAELDQDAFLKIDKVNARKLYRFDIDHPVFSQFKVMENKVYLNNTKIFFENQPYAFGDMEDKEFNTTALSAIQGDVAAQHRLGEIYFNGEMGKDRNVIQAISWFQKASLQGKANSLLQLINIFVQKLIPIDLLKHLEDFLEEVLKEGSSEEQYLFAKSFANEENYEKAAIWYRKAALQGCQEAVSQLLVLEKNMLISKGKNNDILFHTMDQETNKLVKDERKFMATIKSIKFLDHREIKLEVTDFIGELNINDKLIFYKNGNAVSQKNFLVKRILKLNKPGGKATMNIYIAGNKFEIDIKSDQVGDCPPPH